MVLALAPKRLSSAKAAANLYHRDGSESGFQSEIRGEVIDASKLDKLARNSRSSPSAKDSVQIGSASYLMNVAAVARPREFLALEDLAADPRKHDPAWISSLLFRAMHVHDLVMQAVQCHHAWTRLIMLGARTAREALDEGHVPSTYKAREAVVAGLQDAIQRSAINSGFLRDASRSFRVPLGDDNAESSFDALAEYEARFAESALPTIRLVCSLLDRCKGVAATRRFEFDGVSTEVTLADATMRLRRLRADAEELVANHADGQRIAEAVLDTSQKKDPATDVAAARLLHK